VTRRESAAFRAEFLADRVCVVSGAGTGLGRAIALELARCGAVVVGCGRRKGPLAETVDLISAHGGTAWAQPADIRSEAEVESLVNSVLCRHGQIDVLVNNAGGQFYGPAEEVTPKGLRTVVDLNLVGTWTMTRAAALKSMIPQGSGRIITITASPHHGVPGFMATMAARAAVENMTRTLATEWARFNITVLAVAAGAFGSPVVAEKYPPELVHSWEQSTPLGRMGRPEELAYLVAFLASDACQYMTGSVTTVDGGRDNWVGSEEAVREQRRAR
jgi:citronellol/citronellal dehydrogenase